MKKILMIDIDGVVCEHIDNEERERMAEARPYRGSIEQINAWYDEGHTICFFTARTDEDRAVTLGWLDHHGVRYHQIIFNKPRAIHGEEYHYIDDRPVRATTFKGRLSEFVKQRRDVLVFQDEHSQGV